MSAYSARLADGMLAVTAECECVELVAACQVTALVWRGVPLGRIAKELGVSRTALQNGMAADWLELDGYGSMRLAGMVAENAAKVGVDSPQARAARSR